MGGDSSYNHGGMALIRAIEKLIKGGKGGIVIRSKTEPASHDSIWAKLDDNGNFVGIFVYGNSGWQPIFDPSATYMDLMIIFFITLSYFIIHYSLFIIKLYSHRKPMFGRKDSSYVQHYCPTQDRTPSGCQTSPRHRYR